MSGAQILPAEQYFERFAPGTSTLAGEPIDLLFIAPKTLNSFVKSRDGSDLRRKSGDRPHGDTRARRAVNVENQTPVVLLNSQSGGRSRLEGSAGKPGNPTRATETEAHCLD
jgi:hypothetical protein